MALETFSAGGPQFDDQDFLGMAGSTKLRGLTLGHCKMTSEALGAVGKFTDLLALGLTGSAVTDETVRAWADMHEIHTLMLDQTQITSASVPWICSLRLLRHLCIDSRSIASITPEQLDRLSSLQSISLYGNEINPTALSKMSNWKSLVVFRIENATLTRDELSKLIPCLPKSLNVLDLCDCKIDPEVLETFVDCLPERISLGVRGLEVSEDLMFFLLEGRRAVAENESNYFTANERYGLVQSSIWSAGGPAIAIPLDIRRPTLGLGTLNHAELLVRPSHFQ